MILDLPYTQIQIRDDTGTVIVFPKHLGTKRIWGAFLRFGKGSGSFLEKHELSCVQQLVDSYLIALT